MRRHGPPAQRAPAFQAHLSAVLRPNQRAAPCGLCGHARLHASGTSNDVGRGRPSRWRGRGYAPRAVCPPLPDDGHARISRGRACACAAAPCPHRAARTGDRPKTTTTILASMDPSAADLVLAASGDAGAQCRAGARFLARRDYTAAAALFRGAADQGHAGGRYELGACYFEGQGVPARRRGRGCLVQEGRAAGPQARAVLPVGALRVWRRRPAQRPQGATLARARRSAWPRERAQGLARDAGRPGAAAGVAARARCQSSRARAARACGQWILGRSRPGRCPGGPALAAPLVMGRGGGGCAGDLPLPWRGRGPSTAWRAGGDGRH